MLTLQKFSFASSLDFQILFNDIRKLNNDSASTKRLTPTYGTLADSLPSVDNPCVGSPATDFLIGSVSGRSPPSAPLKWIE
jgi:hypothetical protein